MERRPFARLLRCARQAVDTRDHQDVALAEKVPDDEHATMSTDWSVLLSIVWLGDIGNWENRTAFAFATLTAIAEPIFLLAR
jgi:hypothetical protein